jgi:hypothetical protein
MLLGILTLITALSISAVAIYYSVAGLVAIFAAAALPIMIMGGVLEVSKLVTAVWLHRYWKQATWWLKAYLSTAVIVLMLITSMGIFGFLSKAHIEQTAQSTDNLARVETIQSEIDRQLGIISRAENRIQTLENSTSDNSAEVQAQIDKEQERIDNAYTRIQPAIEEQNQIIAGVTQLFQQELDRIDEELATLQGYIDSGDIRKAQGMVGTATDGAYGPKTAAAFTAWQDAKRAERNEWLQKIQNAANSPTVVAARDEIARLRNKAEQQIADSNTLINRLRDQLGNSDNADEIQKAVDEQNERIRSASSEVESLTEEKIQLESEYRKLEAEVGPIKYIAEFIYGDTADNNMLEEAVRWVIITIIFVFDPLAVLLLIASQYTFEYRRKDDSGGWLRQYEQARAQRIIDNPGYNIDDPKEESYEDNRRETREETTQVDSSVPTQQQDENDQASSKDDTVVVSETQGEVSVTTEKEGSGDTAEDSNRDGSTVRENTTDSQRVSVEQEEDTEQTKKVIEDVARTYITTDDSVGDLVPEDDTTNTDASDIRMESTEVQVDEESDTREINKDLENWNSWVEAAEAEIAKEKSKIPDTKNRMFYPEELPSRTYAMKEAGQQVTKEIKSQSEGYIQNAEQNEKTLFSKLKNRPNSE